MNVLTPSTAPPPPPICELDGNSVSELDCSCVGELVVKTAELLDVVSTTEGPTLERDDERLMLEPFSEPLKELEEALGPAERLN